MKRSPDDAVRALVNGVPNGEWDALPELYALDAVVEQPMALPKPLRLEGREAIARHFAAAASLPLKMRAENLVVHRGADPEIVVAEFDYAVRHRDTGAQFNVANVFVVRVRDGLIVESRDYSNHVMFAAGFGRVHDVAEQLLREQQAAVS
jgi:uncharacterized protein